VADLRCRGVGHEEREWKREEQRLGCTFNSPREGKREDRWLERRRNLAAIKTEVMVAAVSAEVRNGKEEARG